LLIVVVAPIANRKTERTHRRLKNWELSSEVEGTGEMVNSGVQQTKDSGETIATGRRIMLPGVRSDRSSA